MAGLDTLAKILIVALALPVILALLVLVAGILIGITAVVGGVLGYIVVLGYEVVWSAPLTPNMGALVGSIVAVTVTLFGRSSTTVVQDE